jgi:uncharacterized protein (DUF427 family)
MKAVLGETVIAEASKEDLISIEGNWYFPPSSVNPGLLVKSDTPYTCPWKGVCQYFSVHDGDTVLQDQAWSYPHPMPSSFKRVGKDYSNYVAFWKHITVTE